MKFQDAYNVVSEYVSDKAADVALSAGFSSVVSILACMGTKQVITQGQYGRTVSAETTTIGKVAEFFSNPIVTQLTLHGIKDLYHNGFDFSNITISDAVKYSVNTAIDVAADVAVGMGMDAILPSIDIAEMDVLKEYLGWKFFNPAELVKGFSGSIIKSAAIAFGRQLPKATAIEITNDLIGKAKDFVLDYAKEAYVEPAMELAFNDSSIFYADEL